MSGELAGEIRDFLMSQDALLPSTFDDDTPLISSGHLDSLALLNLAQWIEEKLQRPLDVSTLDVRSVWDSISRIANFIESDGKAAPPSVPASTPGRAPSGYRIESYQPSLADAIARLQTGLWSPDVELNRAYFRWKDEENPYRREATAYVMFRDDQPIAMRSFYATRWEVGARGQYKDILVADDFLISEGYRNQGLATVLMGHALDDLTQRGEEYLLNLSGGLVTVLHSRAMGWKSAGQLGPAGRRVGWRALLSGRGNRLPMMPNVGSLSGIRLDTRPRPIPMADLIERMRYDGRIRHVRDATYLEWRYRNPRKEYRFLYAGDDPLRGFLVLSWTHHRLRPDPKVSIVDWEAEDPDTLATLLDAAIRVGRFTSLRTWSAATPAADLLEARGFKPMDGDLTRHGVPCILVQSTQPIPPEAWRIHGRSLLGMENWDMRMLFSMAG